MSNFITVPISANGVIFDGSMNDVIAEAMLEIPFGFEDVYLYSHGWSTDAYVAMDEYNQFSVDLSKRILIASNGNNPCLVKPPQSHLGIGIHWPSEVTEDPTSPLNALQLFSFYSMGQRAETVGKNAVYAMLRLILESRKGSQRPLRFFLLGHSFGGRVVCAALNDLQVDIANRTIGMPTGPVTFRVVLLEAAFDNDNLEPTDIYGKVCDIAGIRVLMTISQLDKALGEWYPAASKLQNLFHKDLVKQALGFAGPTPATIGAFHGAGKTSIVPGFLANGITQLTSRLIVADLTPVHQARVDAHLYNGGFSGSHSDINFEEVYQMIMGFLFA
ncbi:MAG: hypothetical protein WBD74_02825 [Candidatus Aquilonibacter sp.]